MGFVIKNKKIYFVIKKKSNTGKTDATPFNQCGNV